MGIKERFEALTSKQKVVTAAVAAVLVAGLGIGGAYAATEGHRVSEAEPAATTSAVTQTNEEAEGTYVVQVGVTAEGYDPDSSSPVIAHVTNGDGTVDFYHAYDANVGEAVEVGGAGEYEVSYITPVNSDGSIYKVGDAVKVTAEESDEDDGTTSGEDEATTSAAKDAAGTATFKKIDAKDVTADQLTKVAEQVAEAVKGGDPTLTGDAGAAVVKKVADNAKANPSADASKVEEKATAAGEAAKSGETTAKTTASSSSSGSATSSKSNANSTAKKASGSSSTISGTGSSSSSGGNSNSASSGSNQQASTHQHSWNPVYRTETVYTTVDKYEDVPVREATFVCSACGAVFDTKDEYYAHSDEMYEKGENHDAWGYGSRIVGYEKKWVGSYQEATGTKQVLDHYECSCGATK